MLAEGRLHVFRADVGRLLFLLGVEGEVLRRPRRETLANALPLAEAAYRKLEGSEALAKAVRDFKK